MSEERRRHDRVAAEALPCVLRDGEGNEEPFQLVDLSESGVRLHCPHEIRAMTRIQVNMVLPAERVGGGEDATLDTTGVVVWSHQAGESGYDTGVFFPELDARSRDLLRAYVHSAD